ncbi:MAG: hypothetical protein CFH01_00472 [Alphaproteobacteria bacterium MarineAlpha2_Bin1]|nr:MAG: hypothetical protein CFH01_00472 [Alphaproteobacteria bacterium MarineAlpha2_Bin1]
MSYFEFIRNNLRFLFFGFLLMFFSSFGQTFFISLFNNEIREVFKLSHGNYGLIYSIATFISGTVIIWAGKLIDNIDLRNFILIVILGLAAGIIILCSSESIILLCTAIFLLRLFGQGLMPHTSMTSMTRYYNQDRGKAISVSSLGLPFGEVILPIISIFLISLIGWRLTWISGLILIIFSIIPIRFFLLKNHSYRHREWELKNKSISDFESKKYTKNFTRTEVLLDKKFYFIIFSILSPAYIMTGLFFHQIHLFEIKGWSLNLLGGTFALYAVITVSASIIIGKLIDSYGSKKLVIFHLFPLSLGLLILSLSTSPYAALLYLGLAGITMGMANSLLSSLWAEIYGTKYIGSIKSLVTALMVYASAFSPFMFGWAIDLGINIELIILLCVFYTLLSSITLYIIFGVKKYN